MTLQMTKIVLGSKKTEKRKETPPTEVIVITVMLKDEIRETSEKSLSVQAPVAKKRVQMQAVQGIPHRGQHPFPVGWSLGRPWWTSSLTTSQGASGQVHVMDQSM